MAEVTINDVARSAWESTRSESTVAYDELIPEYRDKLLARAEAVLNGVYPSEPWLAFETEVCRLADGRGETQVGSKVPELKPEVKVELVEEAEEENGEEIEALDEAAEPIEPKGPLPSDFPAHDKLHEGGINTYTQLSKVDDLTEIAGIGPATVKQILRRLRADRQALNQ